MRRTERKWRVKFLGDPDYGRDEWDERDDSDALEVEAIDASTAARRAITAWRADDPMVEPGWYGEGTVIGVQEIVEPPPVKVFVKQAGRLKLERANA